MTTRCVPRWPACIGFLFVWGAHAQSPLPVGLPEPAAAAYQKGLDAEHQQFFDIALEKYQAALKAAPGSQVCMEAILRIQNDMGDDKAQLATAAKMIASATDAKAKAHAEALQADIYYRQFHAYNDGRGAYEKDPKRAQDALRKSEAAYERAAQDDPQNEPQRMMYAHVLASLHRDEDSSREFAACAAIPGTSSPECARALRLAKSAELGRYEPAPALSASTLDGKPVSLDGLAGKVVLIDFWGSWCKFCVRDSDYVQSLLESFDANSFVLLEVNEGDSEERWKSYVKEHQLKGMQTHDSGETLQSLFRVSGFPTYVILDADGLVRSRYVGARGDLRGDVRKLISARTASAAAGAGK
jgi:thiol-disulfide isomerase/thioredoxin